MIKSRRSLFRRRGFLLASAGTLLSGLGYGLVKWFTGEPDEIVLAVLSRRVGYLKCPPGTFERFAEEYSHWKSRERMLAKLAVVALPLRFLSPYGLLSADNQLRKMEDSIVSQFLLSTDFFLHDADEERELQYLSFYDPHSAICRHPFARPVS